MKKKIFCMIVLFLLVTVLTAGQGMSETSGLRITSPAFQEKGDIPIKYTCDGDNTNPPLQIENAPPQTKSFAIVFDDIDAPSGSYVHWILWNIDSNVKEINEKSAPAGAIQGLNGFKKKTYGGPCPPRRSHRYVFKLYALDVMLNLSPDSTKGDLEKAMKGHILEQAQWTGKYQRRINS